ncbi:MAG TPA: YHS domain-containing protein, partial [Gemmataceae bacterium]|nr:YHS domain-containing protein [Gemmataceae bacterium]
MNPHPRSPFSLQMASAPSPPAIDPVCGMSVDPTTAPAKVVHEGCTYFFCTPSCARKFEADPHRYLHGRPVGMTETPPTPSGAKVQYICPMDPEVVSDR